MQNSRTQFKQTEIGQIPENWEVLNLPDVAKNFDTKRVPLSSRERTKRQGVFPYYGATGAVNIKTLFELKKHALSSLLYNLSVEQKLKTKAKGKHALITVSSYH